MKALVSGSGLELARVRGTREQPALGLIGAPDRERSFGLARVRESFCVRQEGETWLYSRE